MLTLNDLTFVGSNLQRPECVLATRSGHLYTSDWRGGVAVTYPDGNSRLLIHNEETNCLKPNGIALMHDGSLLVTHLGDDTGGVFRLKGNGQLQPFLTEIEGVPLPPTNFVSQDFEGRIWVTVSTRQIPRHSAARPDFGDGFIILMSFK